MDNHISVCRLSILRVMMYFYPCILCTFSSVVIVAVLARAWIVFSFFCSYSDYFLSHCLSVDSEGTLISHAGRYELSGTCKLLWFSREHVVSRETRTNQVFWMLSLPNVHSFFVGKKKTESGGRTRHAGGTVCSSKMNSFLPQVIQILIYI